MIRMPKIVILLETGRSFDRQILRGIGQYSRTRGPWDFHIVSERLDRLKPPTKLWGASGMIARLSSRRLEKAVAATNIPVVVVDGIGSPSTRQIKNRIAAVAADLEEVARLALEHFSNRGFNQFAFVGAPSRGQSVLRHDGLEDAVWPVGRPFIVYPPNASLRLPWIRERNVLADWLEQLPKPIGILACDDERGFQVLEACRSARISVPNQVAVLGIGNDELLCAMADPPLSSVTLTAVQGGYRAAHILDRLMQESLDSQQQLLIRPNSVIVRSSTDIDLSHDPDELS